jgi:hypothetical protein
LDGTEKWAGEAPDAVSTVSESGGETLSPDNCDLRGLRAFEESSMNVVSVVPKSQSNLSAGMLGWQVTSNRWNAWPGMTGVQKINSFRLSYFGQSDAWVSQPEFAGAMAYKDVNNCRHPRVLWPGRMI